ncbi:MAG: glutathione S-transferase family protein [Sneathiellales bacterium]|nr:glutathione S-transferase family protein [Sneathiellales bacterium]
MTLKIYGSPASKAFRPLWAAEEANIKYELVYVHPKDAAKNKDLRNVNPLGKIPALQDGDFCLTESLALTDYILRKYAPDYLPQSLEGQSDHLRWTLFGATEIEPVLIDYLHAKGIPFGDADPVKAEEKLAVLRPLFAFLDQNLTHGYLTEKRFTAADLNMASILTWVKIGKINLTSFPHLSHWLDLCFKRPAYLALREKLRA